MEQALNEPQVVETQEVNTEPATTDIGVQPTGAWDEDFDTTELPTEEPQEEAQAEPQEKAVDLNYVTEGLSPLDNPLVVKRKGKLYDLTDMDQIRNLVEKGLDSTIKNQELAELRRELELTKNPDITEQELSQLDTSAEVEHIAEKIASSNYVEDFKTFIDILPGVVTDQLRGDPQMLEGLRQDVESGLAGKILPGMQRLMDVDNLTFKEAYMKSGSEVMKSKQSRSQAIDKLTAAPTRGSIPEVKSKDIWDLDDSEYRALMDTERR